MRFNRPHSNTKTSANREKGARPMPWIETLTRTLPGMRAQATATAGSTSTRPEVGRRRVMRLGSLPAAPAVPVPGLGIRLAPAAVPPSVRPHIGVSRVERMPLLAVRLRRVGRGEALACHDVDDVRHQSQVCGVLAEAMSAYAARAVEVRIVADVINVGSFRYGPMCELPCDAVGVLGAPLERGAHAPITAHHAGGSPRPALVGAALVDLLPEPLLRGACGLRKFRDRLGRMWSSFRPRHVANATSHQQVRAEEGAD